MKPIIYMLLGSGLTLAIYEMSTSKKFKNMFKKMMPKGNQK